MGYLGDKYSKKMLLSGLYFLRAISIGLFIFLPPSQISALAFGVTFGLVWLATVPATNGIVAQIFGTKNISTKAITKIIKSPKIVRVPSARGIATLRVCSQTPEAGQLNHRVCLHLYDIQLYKWHNL